MLSLPCVGPFVGDGLNQQNLGQAGKRVHHAPGAFSHEQADQALWLAVVAFFPQAAHVLGVNQREVDADVEMKAQPLSDNAGYALEKGPRLVTVVDGSPVAANADEPSIRQVDGREPRWRPADVATARAFLACVADDDGLAALRF